MPSEINTTIRLATPEDIPVLVNHYHRMFKAILESRSRDHSAIDWHTLDQRYLKKLTLELGRGCCAWVAHIDSQIISSGAVTTLSMVPVPDDYGYNVGYLHSLFTQSAYRKQGIAGTIVQHAVTHCRNNGIGRLILNTSKAGRALYESLGFEFADNAMRRLVHHRS